MRPRLSIRNCGSWQIPYADDRHEQGEYPSEMLEQRRIARVERHETIPMISSHADLS